MEGPLVYLGVPQANTLVCGRRNLHSSLVYPGKRLQPASTKDKLWKP